MESEMSNWNDDRLDELNRRVDDGFMRVDREMKEGFAKVDRRFEQVEGEMKEGFAQTASREEIGEVKAQLDRLTDRIDRLYGLLILTMVSVVGSLIANGALT